MLIRLAHPAPSMERFVMEVLAGGLTPVASGAHRVFTVDGIQSIERSAELAPAVHSSLPDEP